MSLGTEDRIKKERLEKAEQLRKLGFNPYSYRFDNTHFAEDLNEKYDKLREAEETKDRVSVAGRIMLLREMGKIAFMHLQDETGKIQLCFKKDTLGDKYKAVKKLDLGDIIGVKGFMFKTKKGEVTVHVQDFDLLTKALLPPPAKYHGLKDTELRYRKRYLDLMMNPEVREVFRKRARIITAFREYLDKEGFVEVETPTLQLLYGGATAKPFVTKHNTLKMNMYLRISDEMYLKRLLVGGIDKVYEICKDFRNEGIDTSHNPEFTMLEWQEAYKDYETGMKRSEEMLAYVVKKVLGTTKVTYQGTKLDFKPPWKRLAMRDGLKKYAKIDVDKMSDDELRKFAKDHKIALKDEKSRGLMIATIFEETCEEFLIQPTFVMDFPHATSPLAKQLRNGEKDFVERFEPYVMGMEIGNNYSELNDPVIQRAFFEESSKDKEEGHPVDEDYIEALEHGMPPSSGCAFGIDRVVMLLTDSASIRDVIFFPTLRNKE